MHRTLLQLASKYTSSRWIPALEYVRKTEEVTHLNVHVGTQLFFVSRSIQTEIFQTTCIFNRDHLSSPDITRIQHDILHVGCAGIPYTCLATQRIRDWHREQTWGTWCRFWLFVWCEIYREFCACPISPVHINQDTSFSRVPGNRWIYLPFWIYLPLAERKTRSLHVVIAIKSNGFSEPHVGSTIVRSEHVTMVNIDREHNYM